MWETTPVPHSLMYSFTLSFHLPSGSPLLFGHSVLLIYTFFYKLFTLHPLSVAKPSLSIPVHPFHHCTLHSICLCYILQENVSELAIE